MDLKNIFNLLSSANLDNEAIMNLITEASTMNLNDEENLRILIRKGASLANKEINSSLENKIISIIKENGISQDLFKNVK